MRCEDFGSGLGAGDAGIPLEAGERGPEIGVRVLGVFETGEETAGAEFGQLKLSRRRRTPSTRLGGVEKDGEQVVEFSLEQTELMAAEAGHEHKSGGLTRDLIFEGVGLIEGELSLGHADVPEHDDVEGREHLRFGKGLEIPGPATEGAHVGMKEQAADLDPGIALERVAEVAVFPAGIGLDEEHFELLFADRDGGGKGVVVRIVLLVCGRQSQSQFKVPDRLGRPENRVLQSSHRGDRDIAVEGLAFARFDFEDGTVVAGEGTREGEGEAHRLAGDPEGGDVEGGHGEIGESCLTADGDGEDGNIAHAKPRGGPGGRFAAVPVAVRDEDEAEEVRVTVEHAGEGGFDVGACGGVPRKRFNRDLEFLVERVPRLRSGQGSGDGLAGGGGRS